jgi:hypothetical protein
VNKEEQLEADAMNGKPAVLQRPWTARGEMLVEDRLVIQGVVDSNRAAARIFVTGEVTEDYIGNEAVRLLINANDIYYKNKAGCEPLFVNTRDNTVRMTRFDPEFVWRCFHPDILAGLVQEEIARIGVEMDPWEMDYFDFYQNMVAALKATYGENVIMVKVRSNADDFYQGIYLACLLLFGKPGYRDVPIAAHFARKEAAEFLRHAVFIQLDKKRMEELEALRNEYGGIQTITNPEMHFIVSIYESEAE